MLDDVIATATSEAPAATPPAPVETPAPSASPTPLPAAAPAAPVTPAAPPTPAAPQSRREARQRVVELASKLAQKAAESAPEAVAPVAAEVVAAPEVRTSEPPPASTTQVPTPAAAAAPLAAAAPVAETPKAVSTPTPEFIRITVPEGHPLHARFKEFVARTPEEEQGIRALVNSYVRSKEVDTLRTQLADFQRKQAFQDATTAATEQWQKTPEYQAHVTTYNELLAERGKEIADRFWQGAQSDLQGIRDGEYQTRVEAIEVQEAQQRAEEWAGEAWQNSQRLPESIRTLPDFREWFEDEAQSFDDAVRRGKYAEWQRTMDATTLREAFHREFTKRFTGRLTREPAATAVLNASTRRLEAESAAAAAKTADQARQIEQIRKQAADQAVAEFKAQAAATRTQATPLGNLVPAGRTVPASPSAPDADGERPPQSMSANAIRRQAREAVRQMVAGRVP